jgi:hypothetical protein
MVHDSADRARVQIINPLRRGTAPDYMPSWLWKEAAN